jgi:hypothetical protein
VPVIPVKPTSSSYVDPKDAMARMNMTTMRMPQPLPPPPPSKMDAFLKSIMPAGSTIRTPSIIPDKMSQKGGRKSRKSRKNRKTRKH